MDLKLLHSKQLEDKPLTNQAYSKKIHTGRVSKYFICGHFPGKLYLGNASRKGSIHISTAAPRESLRLEIHGGGHYSLKVEEFSPEEIHHPIRSDSRGVSCETSGVYIS